MSSDKMFRIKACRPRSSKQFFFMFSVSHIYMDRNLMVENTIFDGKPEPLEISAS